ncbi:MAG TPA: fatty acyl-AMP ligase [Kofleriaceae bacterium]
MADLIQMLEDRRGATPDRRAFHWVEPGGEPRALTYAELFDRAISVAAHLQARPRADGLVVLLYPPGLEFVVGFWGTILAGMIAVPANLPDTARSGRGLSRLRSILDDTSAGLVLSSRETAAELRTLELCNALDVIATDDLTSFGDVWKRPAVDASDLAYLQYTSGSTSAAKGVMVTHGNIIAQAHFLAACSGFSADSVSVTWVPPYHDQGLVSGICEPVVHGHLSVLMSPQAFAVRPATWLRAISDHRGTHSGGPNFAYDLCVRKVSEAEREPLDLSSWQVAYNGAEPVRPATLERFARTFGPSGFAPRAFQATYGLAEATMRVAGSPLAREVTVTQLDADELARGQAMPAREGHKSVALCGHGPPEYAERVVKIVGEPGRECATGQLGEIWAAGPDVAGGYWRRDSEPGFHGDLGDGRTYVRTGDLGFVHDGELYIAGRLKDLIIVRGRNIYPQDIELIVEQAHPAIRPGCVAAFAVERDGEEHLVIVAEVRDDHQDDAGAAVTAIRKAVTDEEGVRPGGVVLVRPRSIAKTSSGKIQRGACRDAYVSGGLEHIARWPN